jgi:hypothetical protein
MIKSLKEEQYQEIIIGSLSYPVLVNMQPHETREFIDKVLRQQKLLTAM